MSLGCTYLSFAASFLTQYNTVAEDPVHLPSEESIISRGRNTQAFNSTEEASVKRGRGLPPCGQSAHTRKVTQESSKAIVSNNIFTFINYFSL